MSLAARDATFRDLELRKVRPSHVEAWVKQMSVRGLAPSTVKTRFVNVRSVFRAAIRDKMIAADPTTSIRLPRQRKREASMEIPTPAQVRAIIDAADERFVAFIAVCAFAGLRLGEAAALKFDDVDFLRRQLCVRRQVQRAGADKVEIRLPKYGSERDVPLPDQLLAVLSRHVELQEGVRLHDLRHFYASGLIAAGCDVVTVQRALGNSKASTTLETYSHLWPSAEDKTRKAAAVLADEVLAIDGGKIGAREPN